MLNETFISFYLSSFRIHIFRKAIAEIGEPKYIRFLVKDEGPSMIMEAYDKKDFSSHKVKLKGDESNGSNGMEINSYPLCSLLKNRLGWDAGKSYRVPGRTYPNQHLAVFDLTAAEQIHTPQGGENDESTANRQF